MTVGDFLVKNKFDFYALACSSIYFLLFVIYLGFEMSKTPYAPGGDTALTAMRIITLILPIVYFGKLAYNAIWGPAEFNVNGGVSIQRFQLIILMVYFVLVFLLLCSLAAANFTAVGNINTLMVYILPLLVIASFYGTYEIWKDKNFAKGSRKVLLVLNFVLSFLYYTLFYSSVVPKGDTPENTAVNSGLIILSIILMFMFGYMAFGSYKRAKSAGEISKWF